MLVVSDADYDMSVEKLRLAGFWATLPRRDPAPEILQRLLDPAKTLRELHAQYAKLDRVTTTFDYPVRYNHADVQLVLIPASYAHLSESAALRPQTATSATSLKQQFDVCGNLYYPLEYILLESFIRVILDDGDATGINQWWETLNVWVGTICGYMDVENDDCPDDAVREWFSQHWGRKREAKFGPMDRRVSKRLGSGREMPYDVRHRPVAS